MAAEISVANGWDTPSDDTLLGPCAFSRAFSAYFCVAPKTLAGVCESGKEKWAENGRKNGR